MVFKKGQSGNPAGSLPIPDDIKVARRLTLEEFERAGHKIWFMGFKDIATALNKANSDPRFDLPAGEMALMSLLYHGIKDGNSKNIEFFVNRLIGPIPQRIRSVIQVEETTSAPIKMSNEEKLAMLDFYREQILEQEEEDVVDVSASGRENKP